MPHTLAGFPTISPKALENPPWETTFVNDHSNSTVFKKDIIVFPHAKSSNFTLTMPSIPTHVIEANKTRTFPYKPNIFFKQTQPSQSVVEYAYQRPETLFSRNLTTSAILIPENKNSESSRNKTNGANYPQSYTKLASIPITDGVFRRNISTTSLGDSKDNSTTYSAYASLPAALEPNPTRTYTASTGILFNTELKELPEHTKYLSASRGAVHGNVRPARITLEPYNLINVSNARPECDRDRQGANLNEERHSHDQNEEFDKKHKEEKFHATA